MFTSTHEFVRTEKEGLRLWCLTPIDLRKTPPLQPSGINLTDLPNEIRVNQQEDNGKKLIISNQYIHITDKLKEKVE